MLYTRRVKTKSCWCFPLIILGKSGKIYFGLLLQSLYCWDIFQIKTVIFLLLSTYIQSQHFSYFELLVPLQSVMGKLSTLTEIHHFTLDMLICVQMGGCTADMNMSLKSLVMPVHPKSCPSWFLRCAIITITLIFCSHSMADLKESIFSTWQIGKWCQKTSFISWESLILSAYQIILMWEILWLEKKL